LALIFCNSTSVNKGKVFTLRKSNDTTTEQNRAIAQTIWMLASAIQNLNCIDGSANAADWLEAAKKSIANACERVQGIELP
jgi:hemoglobin-like flavoprotein